MPTPPKYILQFRGRQAKAKNIEDAIAKIQLEIPTNATPSKIREWIVAKKVPQEAKLHGLLGIRNAPVATVAAAPRPRPSVPKTTPVWQRQVIGKITNVEKLKELRKLQQSKDPRYVITNAGQANYTLPGFGDAGYQANVNFVGQNYVGPRPRGRPRKPGPRIPKNKKAIEAIASQGNKPSNAPRLENIHPLLRAAAWGAYANCKSILGTGGVQGEPDDVSERGIKLRGKTTYESWCKLAEAAEPDFDGDLRDKRRNVALWHLLALGHLAFQHNRRVMTGEDIRMAADAKEETRTCKRGRVKGEKECCTGLGVERSFVRKVGNVPEMLARAMAVGGDRRKIGPFPRMLETGFKNEHFPTPVVQFWLALKARAFLKDNGYDLGKDPPECALLTCSLAQQWETRTPARVQSPPRAPRNTNSNDNGNWINAPEPAKKTPRRQEMTQMTSQNLMNMAMEMRNQQQNPSRKSPVTKTPRGSAPKNTPTNNVNGLHNTLQKTPNTNATKTPRPKNNNKPNKIASPKNIGMSYAFENSVQYKPGSYAYVGRNNKTPPWGKHNAQPYVNSLNALLTKENAATRTKWNQNTTVVPPPLPPKSIPAMLTWLTGVNGLVQVGKGANGSVFDVPIPLRRQFLDGFDAAITKKKMAFWRGYGIPYEGKSDFVVKVIDGRTAFDKGHRDFLVKHGNVEIRAMMELNNAQPVQVGRRVFDPKPYVPKLFGAAYVPSADSLVIVMEKAIGTPLSQIKNLPNKTIVDIEKAILSIWFGGYAHGDAHGGNIIVQPNGSVKILDFGLVHKMSQPGIDLLKKMYLQLLNDQRTVKADVPKKLYDAYLKDTFETLSKQRKLGAKQHSNANMINLAWKKHGIPGEQKRVKTNALRMNAKNGWI